MGEHRKYVGKLVGCAAIVSAAAVTLGLSVHHDLQITAGAIKPSSTKHETYAFQQEECVYRAIRSELPKGAPVYVGNPGIGTLAAPNPGWAQWRAQRLSELSTLWAVPQANPATARWRLFLVTAHGHCSGLALEVRRV